MDGADRFFGEPAFKLDELLRPRPDGKGTINVLASERLVQSPRLYSAFLLWLMSELWEELPEVGDQDKPKLVFFFDEAHLLFRDAPKELVNKVEQVVRLIRSKGVGIYFVTQSPTDIPEIVLASSATASSTRCAPTRRRTRKPCAPRRNRSAPMRTSMSRRKSRSWASAKRWSPRSTTKARRRRSRAPRSARRTAKSARSCWRNAQALMRANTAGRVYEKAIDRESAHEILGKRAAQLAEAEAREEEREAREKEAARSSHASALDAARARRAHARRAAAARAPRRSSAKPAASPAACSTPSCAN